MLCSRAGNALYAHAQSNTVGQTMLNPPGPIQELCESLKTNWHYYTEYVSYCRAADLLPPQSVASGKGRA